MVLASSLASLADGTLPKSFEGLKSHIDPEWIKSALDAHGVATVRKRKLPAEQVVWLAVGISLYRDRPIPEVVNRLDLVLPDENGQRQGITNGAIVEPATAWAPNHLRISSTQQAGDGRWNQVTGTGGEG